MVNPAGAQEASSTEVPVANEESEASLPAPLQWKPGTVQRQRDGTVTLAPLGADEGEQPVRLPTRESSPSHTGVTDTTGSSDVSDLIDSPGPAFELPIDPDRQLNPKLLNLPPNRWVKFHEPEKLGWRRQPHAGIAYDMRRGTLLVFGSDTHGGNWDNSVHEFDPVKERWETHYPPAARETYRADAQGNAVAGHDRLLPWAMHTFDSVVYDPRLDALVVTAVPGHNPIRKEVRRQIDPTWIYDLKTREWRIFANNGKRPPGVFAGASAYDSARDVVVVYKGKSSGKIWELWPNRSEWTPSARSHHEIHFTMEADAKHQKLVVFGNYGGSRDVWVYTPGRTRVQVGKWDRQLPTGDDCPAWEHFPVAYDWKSGVFLIIPKGITCIYDLGSNQYTRLPDAEIDVGGMNYMMVYDIYHEVFLLVTGDWRKPPSVWAMKLNPDVLP